MHSPIIQEHHGLNTTTIDNRVCIWKHRQSLITVLTTMKVNYKFSAVIMPTKLKDITKNTPASRLIGN